MKGQTNQFILGNKLQRNLRKAMTDAEKKLWLYLRGKQSGGYKFRRQHPFGDFILDFVCMETKLVIEIDGGQHMGSIQDQARDQVLAHAGFRVIRFWNNQVLNELDSVMEAIWHTLETHPHPNLPLEGEGTNVKNKKPQAHPHPNPPLEGEGVCNGDK